MGYEKIENKTIWTKARWKLREFIDLKELKHYFWLNLKVNGKSTPIISGLMHNGIYVKN